MLKLNPDEIKKNNYYSLYRYKEMKEMISNYESDSYKEKRLKNKECKSCYYLKNGASFQAFTDYNCWNCESKNTWHNSNTPRYCNQCSDEHNVCKRCGASLEEGDE